MGPQPYCSRGSAAAGAVVGRDTASLTSFIVPPPIPSEINSVRLILQHDVHVTDPPLLCPRVSGIVGGARYEQNFSRGGAWWPKPVTNHGKLATVAASPSIMNMTAAGLRDSMTTITRTARTGVFATARAMGNLFAASGPAINIAQSSRISKAVRLGSLIRSRHSPTKLRLSPRTTEARWRLGTVTGLFATLAASLYGLENFRN